MCKSGVCNGSKPLPKAEFWIRFFLIVAASFVAIIVPLWVKGPVGLFFIVGGTIATVLQAVLMHRRFVRNQTTR